MDYLASEENCNIDYKITRKITILATQRKLEAFTFLTSQVSTVLTILARRAGSTLLLVRWDSNPTKNGQKTKEGTFLDFYSQVQLCRNGGCQWKPCHQDSPIDNLDTSCHSFLSAFLCIFSIPRRPVFIFYADISPKQRKWLACSFMISTHVASPLSKSRPMPWLRNYNGIS